MRLDAPRTRGWALVSVFTTSCALPSAEVAESTARASATSEQACTAEAGPLTTADTLGGDHLGQAVAMSGAAAVVGAPGDDHAGGMNAGSAYVWRLSGGSWTEAQKLTAMDATSYDAFGSSVGISGDVLVVGVPGDDDRGTNAGAAHVFRWNGAAWVHEQKLLAKDGQASDVFGSAVSVSGDVIAVGAKQYYVSGKIGAAYVFRRSGGAWVEEQRLAPSGAVSPQEFGASVAASGDLVVVGSASEKGSCWSCYGYGAAYVFRFDGASWAQEARLAPLDPSGGSAFGGAVATSGDTVLVGAPMKTDPVLGGFAGAAYLFRWSGAGWTQAAKLLASGGGYNDQFGAAVGVADGVAVVGAYNDSNERGLWAGAAYVFTESETGAWSERARLVASASAELDAFGRSVATAGGRVIVGADADDDRGVDSGSFYVAGCAGDPCAADGDGDGVSDCDDLCPADPAKVEPGTCGCGVPESGCGDATAPTAGLTAPAAGSTLSGTVTVAATAADDVGVTRVEFYRGTTLLGADTSAPYSALWNTTGVPNGAYSLTARAYDAAGNTGVSAARSVSVLNPVADTTPPTVAITSPKNGATVARSSPVTITATAADNAGVARVEFYVDGGLLATDTTSPYAAQWIARVPRGSSHALRARAVDTGGNASWSPVVTVTAW